jgi:uncharacterized membrane protein
LAIFFYPQEKVVSILSGVLAADLVIWLASVIARYFEQVNPNTIGQVPWPVADEVMSF